MEILKWIENWYKEQCDGDWEHQYGIDIKTIDNPGWIVKIDLTDTKLEKLVIKYTLVENSEDDWYGFSVKDKAFDGGGDPSKLSIILEKFKEIALLRPV